MKKEFAVFDKPENVKRFLRVFYVCLGVLILIDPFIHKHTEFPWEGAFGFFASYGFASCVLLIFIAKGLRIFLKKDEQYYDR